MREAVRCVSLACAAMLVLVGPGLAAAEERFTVKDVGFASPSAVRHDSIADLYLVSNINGPALSRDNNGFISRVSPDGKVQALKWIAGGRRGATLHAPKGMTIAGGRLYVADLDVIRVFDVRNALPLPTIRVPGAIALTDVVVASDGRLIISDIGRDFASGAIFQVDPQGKVTVLAKGDHLLRPNALAMRQDGSVLYAPLVGGLVVALSKDGKVTDFRNYPPIVLPNWPARKLGRLSGVVLLDGATALVTSKEAQTVARIKLDGPSKITEPPPYERGRQGGRYRMTAAPPSEFFLSDLIDPARLDLDRKRARLLVPEVSSNSIVIAPLPRLALAAQSGG